MIKTCTVLILNQRLTLSNPQFFYFNDILEDQSQNILNFKKKTAFHSIVTRMIYYIFWFPQNVHKSIIIHIRSWQDNTPSEITKHLKTLNFFKTKYLTIVSLSTIHPVFFLNSFVFSFPLSQQAQMGQTRLSGHQHFLHSASIQEQQYNDNT